MITKTSKNAARLKRHASVRAEALQEPPERPRLRFLVQQHIHAQVIDDVNGVTLVECIYS